MQIGRLTFFTRISGGQLATITFKPERAYSYEGGIKADLFDRRFRSNLAVFHVDYKAIQYTTSGLLTGVASSAPFAQAVVSSADGKASGFEWENTVVPVNGLTLTANVGYTDFKFKQGTIFPGFVLQSGAPGYQPFQRPKWPEASRRSTTVLSSSLAAISRSGPTLTSAAKS